MNPHCKPGNPEQHRARPYLGMSIPYTDSDMECTNTVYRLVNTLKTNQSNGFNRLMEPCFKQKTPATS
jgi:hypothetical protein